MGMDDHIVPESEWAVQANFTLCAKCEHPVMTSRNQHCNYNALLPVPHIVAQDVCANFGCGCVPADTSVPPPTCTACGHTKKGIKHIRFNTGEIPYYIEARKCQEPGCTCEEAT